MAQPVPEQALSKLSSNLSRETLNQETKIAGASKKTSQMKEELCIDKFEREKNGKAGEQQHSGMLYIRNTLKISYLLGLYLRSIYFRRPTCPFWRSLIPSLQRPVAKRDTERSEGGGEHQVTPSGCGSCPECRPSLLMCGFSSSALLGDGGKHKDGKNNR